MRRVFMTKTFAKWARKSGPGQARLCGAVDEIVRGQGDADLGGGLYKHRVALPGRGKRGSCRVVIATNHDDRWYFLYGFQKNDRASIDDRELKALKLVANALLELDGRLLDRAIRDGELQEICDGKH